MFRYCYYRSRLQRGGEGVEDAWPVRGKKNEERRTRMSTRKLRTRSTRRRNKIRKRKQNGII